MTTTEIRQLLARALQTELDAIPPDARLGEPSIWDSAGHMFVVVEVEEALDRALDNDEVMEMTSVEAIRNLFETAEAR
jgi:acyl carrier protein